ncbi:MAG: helix-turn-helix domain-containing protein [Methylobacter tundripaludum]|jgi:transcriptional regulator with XRE-family HTH domain|uniref:Helix-turn-helix protein n=1 Tax=Methylobacter tundripaludum TaxID=173365 RepID=A0A2S6GVU5_9GAMM|nr:helix-turn-helix transcriptional regulator [Methylobacter tundripaludum]MCK9637865.1 helix-turn-helix domain-containing protein [Methylobacter tundripaludum]PPK69365.1 helix-turn-helix protein [Methylobacter tundripaludum]
MKTSDYIQKIFGVRIRELRKSKGFSQESFSFECKLDRTYVSQVEQGKRNISLQNIKIMADALNVPIAALFSESYLSPKAIKEPEIVYKVKDNFSIQCGFQVSGQDILTASNATAEQLQLLPFSLYQSIDLKTLSAIVGAVFVGDLAEQVGAIVNPIEKGHPDIIPASGHIATEAQLRNYPDGLEIKVTVGNVSTGSNLQPGTPRINQLTGITWQAHHREVKSLLGLTIDFAGTLHEGKYYPVITGVFYANDLTENDWGEISGTTGRNTKVTGMKISGKKKMGSGWVLLLDKEMYLKKYSAKLKIILER